MIVHGEEQYNEETRMEIVRQKLEGLLDYEQVFARRMDRARVKYESVLSRLDIRQDAGGGVDELISQIRSAEVIEAGTGSIVAGTVVVAAGMFTINVNLDQVFRSIGELLVVCH